MRFRGGGARSGPDGKAVECSVSCSSDLKSGDIVVIPVEGTTDIVNDPAMGWVFDIDGL